MSLCGTRSFSKNVRIPLLSLCLIIPSSSFAFAQHWGVKGVKGS